MRTCEICGKQFSRRAGESSGNFKRKKTCSVECSKLLMRKKKLIPVSPRVCQVCGEEFLPRSGEKTKDFNKRLCCSKECKNKLVSKNYTKYPTEKTCEICGEIFYCPPDTRPAVFYRRKTCSKACETLLRSKTRRMNLPPKICVICGKEFSRRATEKSTDYRERETCSKTCGFKLISQRGYYEFPPKICVICGKEFSRTFEDAYSYRSKQTCSLECSYKKAQETTMERYGVPWQCMTENCRTSYRTISKPNKEFASKLDALEVSYELEFPLENRSYDLKVGDILVEINPHPFHNVSWNPFDILPEEDYHLDKTLLANKHGYRCLHVFDWDDLDKIINFFIDKDTLYARNLEIKEVPMQECRDFLNKYHLQNDTHSQPVRLGLYTDELVMVMTFGEPRYNKNYEYELLRLCTKPEYKIVGGANRLFKRFLKEYNPDGVVSYCDKAKFSGDVYLDLGFDILRDGRPSKHWYHPDGTHFTDGQVRKHGFDRLVGKDYDVAYGKGTSNNELMREYGFVEIFDCGQTTYDYRKTSKVPII